MLTIFDLNKFSALVTEFNITLNETIVVEQELRKYTVYLPKNNPHGNVITLSFMYGDLQYKRMK